MAKKKKQTNILKLSRSKIIILSVVVAIVGSVAITNIFASQQETYQLDQPTELAAITLTDTKPLVISKDANGKVSYESRGKSINVTTEGTVFCTPDGDGPVKVADVSQKELGQAIKQIASSRPAEGTQTNNQPAASIGNSKLLQVPDENSVGSIVGSRTKTPKGLAKAEQILDQLCKKARRTVPDSAVPVFAPQSTNDNTSAIQSTFALVPKVSAGGGAPGEPAISPAVEDDQIRLINHERRIRGLAQLGKSNCLTTAARKWSRHMALVNTLYHSNLQQTVESECGPNWWRKIGENVGKSQDSASVFQAYMNSPGHRANILDGAYQRVGVGANYYKHPSNSWTILWTTQLFAACQGSCANK